MNIRPFASVVAAAALLSTSVLVTPAATAATVTRSGVTCTITFTQQDFDDFRTHFASYDDSVASRLSAAVPGQEDEIALITGEIINVMREGGSYSTEANAAWSRYFAAGRAQGFTNNDLTAMMLMTATPAAMSYLLPTFEQSLLGVHTLTPTQAAYIRDGLTYSFPVVEEILGSGTYNDIPLSQRAKEIVEPARGVLRDFEEGLKEPYQACVDGKTGTFRIGADDIDPPGGGNGNGGNGNGNGNGNGDGGNGSGGNGNGNGPNPPATSGGSSFGSS
ncbi:hypothetical protein HMPREF0290_0657 [Corynebacterium efficiens YS-314]|uniref:Uncharacterized protein n=1 Tax=Corynebacterium efficiens (strain DSM 44549 / YS-314 / AJ 12310 / JCM 11189 / NBRC 100395) TaxID=196164 RepID=Q8FQ47_COREF|nr:hypothetical protein [Corynebacterium efficiens]EEW50766.1 hypothetical protein HMPREF0290_0657 [Corynebacterium efficiens YS-314]BAC18097.1 hypothetical protein [Corynebacterium efficiens YS-314]